jgi:hypothetical protein
MKYTFPRSIIKHSDLMRIPFLPDRVRINELYGSIDLLPWSE